ncbi:MAG: hypothetical protein JWR72_832 [Flavisolibacter sp.]|jgi:hypothetical protein|nr:hypothetical protein [Flavisolibacter sp.]
MFAALAVFFPNKILAVTFNSFKFLEMDKAVEPQYIIPASYRKMENMHIIFWLGKDIAWCMIWKPIGIAMIIPTLVISIIIAWRTRAIKSELAHNLAITFWISANSLWMISEFFNFDTMLIWRSFTGKHLALLPFSIGVLLLARYYLFQKPKEEKTEVVTM